MEKALRFQTPWNLGSPCGMQALSPFSLCSTLSQAPLPDPEGPRSRIHAPAGSPGRSGIFFPVTH